MAKPDILIFMSDQHSPIYSGFGGSKIVETPNLDKIAQEGVVFDAAYTSCPLCVPARVSMLTGQLPSKTGVFTNNGAISEEQPTFIHSLAIQGYETVLCGRMHFMGKDQRHGFTKRIMGDITAIQWGVKEKMAEELGDFNGTLGENGCHKVIGGGNSPVLEYDKAVIKAALEYLSVKHDKPQCIVVGTYAPHFSYVAPPDLYQYYKDKVELPESTRMNTEYYHPATKHKEQHTDDENIKNIRAAYFGMITNLDRQIGQVHKEWKNYLNNSEREGVFVYLSDHGDQIGERNLYGKKTFFEGSSRIPLIFEGSGIQKGHQVKGAVSIMDLGPTLCGLVGTNPPAAQHGKSLVSNVTQMADDINRPVISEFIDRMKGKAVAGRMVRRGDWKLISYASYEENDALFNIKEDPFEIYNVIGSNPDVASELRKIINENWEVDIVLEEFENREVNHVILSKWGKMMNFDESERWNIPKESTSLPKIF